MNKNLPFRSYHPHYLHSYSYAEPVTPHFYFAQLNPMNRPVFFVKDNDTFSGN